MEVLCSFNVTIPKLDEPFQTILTSLYTIIAVPIVVLNFLVISAIWKTAALHKPSKIILVNLALADFFSGSIICPITALGNVLLMNRWIGVYCSIWIIAGPLVYGLLGVNIFILTVMSVDRFLAIKIKLTYRNIVTNKRAIASMVFGWTIFLCLSVIVSIFLSHGIPIGIFLNLVISIIAIFLCILAIITFLSFYYLKKYTSQTHNSNQQLPNTSSPFDVRSYRRTFHTMLIVFLAIFSSFLPYCCIVAIKHIAKTSHIFGNLSPFAWYIVIFNSSINPVLYLWRMKDLRQAVKAILRRPTQVEP